MLRRKNMIKMAIPEAWIKGIVHESFPHNGIYPLRCSGNCVIVGDICVSHAFGACNPDVNCLGYRGDCDIVFSCHDSKGVNNEGYLILDSPNVVKQIDMLDESDKSHSPEVVAGIGLGKCDLQQSIGYYLSQKLEVGRLNDDVFPEFGASLADKCSTRKFDKCRRSADLSAYNAKLRLCSESLSTSEELTEGERTNFFTKNFQETLSFDCESDALQNSRHCYQIWRVKENNHLIWQKSSSHNNIKGANLQESNYSEKTNSFSDQCLLPSPVYSSSDHSRGKRVAKAGPKPHARINNVEFAHSALWVPQLKLKGSYSRWFSQSIQMDALEAETYETTRVTYGDHTVCQKNRRGQGGFVPHQASLWVPCQPHDYSNSHAAERTTSNCRPVVPSSSCFLDSSSAVSAHGQPNLMKFRIPGQDGLQPSDRKKVYRSRVFKHFCSPINRRQNSGIEPNNGYKLGHGAAGSKAIWVPIGTKDSGFQYVAHSPSVCDSPDAVQVSCNDSTISNPHGDDVPLSVTNVENGSENSKVISTQTLASVQFQASKPGIAGGPEAEIACDENKGAFAYTLFQGGGALNSAQRLQIISEVLLMSGHPVAGIERFLHSAAPVVARSILFDNHQSNGSVSEHKIPRISLSAVWDWYEKPGNYGLEVKAEDLRETKDSGTITTPFHAYFVPQLSAIQLFAFPIPSDSFGEDQENVKAGIMDQIEGPKYSSTKTISLGDGTVAAGHSWLEDTEFGLNFDPTDEAVISSQDQPNGGDVFNLISPTCCSDAELVFEFFESEQPHKRKPLHLKIMELINAGTSNPHIYGDPSKLESGNLHAIHPCSWFSVAWYPIYRIPEGRFRASFLTYHSVGQFVGKYIPMESHNEKFPVVFPVVGLKSYNTKGECWFNPSSKASASNSKFLRERLRTLEETALLLSRGSVNKNKVNIANQHPDYEFFVSRKY